MLNLMKPEYLWRPSQILRRIAFKPSKVAAPIPLPWKQCTINACSAEVIGFSIATQGVYDLPVTEAIVRLAERGDRAIDVGANIGYMSLVMARAVGSKGQVQSFEPNDHVLHMLRANVQRWMLLDVAPIDIQTIALSDHGGEGLLGFPDDYDENCGVASLETGNGTIPVKLRRLDSMVDGPIGVMKVDVEGHEAAVFAGAEKLLERKAIRDIVFEEHLPYPAPAHKILIQHGYRIFRLTRTVLRPVLLSPESAPRQSYLPSNFLATADPARALARFQEWGWKALSS